MSEAFCNIIEILTYVNEMDPVTDIGVVACACLGGPKPGWPCYCELKSLKWQQQKLTSRAGSANVGA